MAVIAEDIKYKKSRVVSDTAANGAEKGSVLVVSGARHSLFPRVTKTERLNGVTRYRKEFWCNENSSDDVAYGVLQWLETISNADDRFMLVKGTQTDTQSDVATPASGDVPLWTGCGNLAVLLSGAETSVQVLMESDDYLFENGGLLHVADKVKTAQTIASDVNIGDSVLFGTQWEKITSTSDIAYPNGLYLGSNNVLTLEDSTNEEWPTIAEKNTTGEVIGTGDGVSATPALTNLASLVNGLSKTEGKVLVVTTVNSSDIAMTAIFNPGWMVDTDLSDATSGTIGEDGIWTADIDWISPPKSGADIVASYWDQPYVYSGNTVTIELDTPIANSYAIADTFVSGCVFTEEVVSSFDSWVLTSASGTYDDTTYPLTPHNVGAEEDEITITFTSGIAFNVSGTRLGSLGSGTVSADLSPSNPSTGQSMFTLLSAGWGGTWAIGDTIKFTLHPSAQGIWLKEVVPAGTTQEPNNLLVLGWYSE